MKFCLFWGSTAHLGPKIKKKLQQNLALGMPKITATLQPNPMKTVGVIKLLAEIVHRRDRQTTDSVGATY